MIFLEVFWLLYLIKILRYLAESMFLNDPPPKKKKERKRKERKRTFLFPYFVTQLGFLNSSGYGLNFKSTEKNPFSAFVLVFYALLFQNHIYVPVRIARRKDVVYPFGADLAFPNSDLGPAEVLVLAPAPSPSGSPVSRDKLWATQEG